RCHVAKRLRQAALGNDAEAVRRLLGAGCPPDLSEEGEGLTALHLAAGRGAAEVVEVLLDMGAAPNAVARDGSTTPLLLAVLRGHEAAAAAIARWSGELAVARNPAQRRSELFRHLWGAVMAGDAELCGRLVRAGCPGDSADADGRTALHLAAARGDAAVVEALLGAGASPEAVAGDGSTPLLGAVLAGDVADAAMSVLVRVGGASLATDVGGAGPATEQLLEAVSGGNESRSRRLLAAGCRADRLGVQGLSALHCAARAGSHRALVGALVAAAEDVNVLSVAQHTPLFDAVSANRLVTAAALRAHGGQMYALVTGMGSPKCRADPKPVDAAHSGGARADARLRSEGLRGARGGAMAGGEDDALYEVMAAALTAEDADQVEQLAAAGYPLELQAPNGVGTALHLAARQGSERMVALLLRLGADANALSEQEASTPLLDAVVLQRDRCAEVLRAAGGKLTRQLLQELGGGAVPGAAGAAPTSARFAPFATDRALMRHLAEVIAQADLAGVRRLLAAGCPPDAQDAHGQPALHLAVRHDAPEIAAALLAAKADHLARNAYGLTALEEALVLGQAECADAMIYSGARVTWTAGDDFAAGESEEKGGEGSPLLSSGRLSTAGDKGGEGSPLLSSGRLSTAGDAFLSGSGRHLSVSCHLGSSDRELTSKLTEDLLYSPVKKLVPRPADTSRRLAATARGTEQAEQLRPQRLLSELVVDAAGRGDEVCMTRLLDAGCSPQARNSDARCALHVASANGMEGAVALLLARGARVNAVDRQGHTALREAVQHQRDGPIRTLLAAGAKLFVDKETEANMGVQMAAAAAAGRVEEVMRLLEAGCPPEIGDYDHRTGLHMAAAHGHVAVLERLLQHGASANVRDRRECTPLNDAADKGHVEATELLKRWNGKFGGMHAVNQLCDASSKVHPPLRALAPCGMHAVNQLCDASSKGDLQRLKLLVQTANLDVNVADYEGRTSLHICASNGHRELVRFLVEHGADVHALDLHRHTPLRNALQNSHFDTILILMRESATMHGRPGEQGDGLARPVTPAGYSPYHLCETESQYFKALKDVFRHTRWELLLVCWCHYSLPTDLFDLCEQSAFVGHVRVLVVHLSELEMQKKWWLDIIRPSDDTPSLVHTHHAEMATAINLMTSSGAGPEARPLGELQLQVPGTPDLPELRPQLLANTAPISRAEVVAAAHYGLRSASHRDRQESPADHLLPTAVQRGGLRTSEDPGKKGGGAGEGEHEAAAAAFLMPLMDQKFFELQIMRRRLGVDGRALHGRLAPSTTFGSGNWSGICQELSGNFELETQAALRGGGGGERPGSGDAGGGLQRARAMLVREPAQSARVVLVGSLGRVRPRGALTLASTLGWRA
ncbi:hypothetical protein CYMTET_34586, partial [Cymbomonas tetramitiformis]